MNCSEVSSLLSLYLDEELNDLRRKQVNIHIQKCPACSHDLATLAKTVRAIRATAGWEPENDLSDIVHPQRQKAGLKSLTNPCEAITCKVKRRGPYE
jgi:anti-sigma factor RsiW